MHGNLSTLDLLKMLFPFSIGLSALIGWFLGRKLLPLLRRLQVGQEVRDDGPASHFIKSGTPTFAGFIFLIPVIFLLLGTVIFRASFEEQKIYLLFLLALVSFGAVGFWDDYTKVRKTKEGLSFKTKTLSQLAVSLLVIVAYFAVYDFKPFIIYPFGQGYLEIQGLYLIPYALFLLCYFYFSTNAVNVTDGIDGLSSSVTMVSSLVLLAIVFFIEQHLFLFTKLDAPAFITSLPAIAYVIKWMIGGLFAYYLYNKYPAKCFMGDLGSLSMGAYISLVVILLGAPWFMFLFGVIYVIEAFSVVIQVTYFKITKGKRIFRMSPIHHHFELGGWKEPKIVAVFCLIQGLGAILGMGLYMMQLFRLR